MLGKFIGVGFTNNDPQWSNNLDRKPLNFLILVVLPRKLTCPLKINSSYVSFRGCTCFRCLLRLGLILSWLEQARNTRTHFSSCEISILGSWCPFHFGWLDSDPAFFWSCFFFGTTSTSEEIYVVFPAILGIFNVFLETTKHFHNKCSLVCPWIWARRIHDVFYWREPWERH